MPAVVVSSCTVQSAWAALWIATSTLAYNDAVLCCKFARKHHITVYTPDNKSPCITTTLWLQFSLSLKNFFISNWSISWQYNGCVKWRWSLWHLMSSKLLASPVCLWCTVMMLFYCGCNMLKSIRSFSVRVTQITAVIADGYTFIAVCSLFIVELISSFLAMISHPCSYLAFVLSCHWAAEWWMLWAGVLDFCSVK